MHGGMDCAAVRLIDASVLIRSNAGLFVYFLSCERTPHTASVLVVVSVTLVVATEAAC